MLQLQKRPLEEARHGKMLTLKDYGIKNGSTLFLLKVGITLTITNPEVYLPIAVRALTISSCKTLIGVHEMHS